MPRSSGDSSSEHSRERMVTLPPIRVVFRDQLSPPSPRPSPRPSHSTYGGSSVYQPFASGPRPHSSASSRAPSSSPDIRFGRRDSSWTSLDSQRPAAPGLRPSLSYGASFASQQPILEQTRSHDQSPASTLAQHPPRPGGYHYSSAAESHRYARTHGGDPSRPSAASSSAWTEHRRRDSMDSAWSSHSSSSAASFQPRCNPPPSSSNALQFQPLPHTHMSSSSRPASYASTQYPDQGDYHSPFGVLIADADPRAPSSSDPQRTAIIRTLRASGIQGSFQINFDDPSSSQNPPRYSCEYCGKGFARPSSLKIHINSHTGEKPFQCPHPDCGRRFSVHSNMRRHYRVHGGDAPKADEASGEDELADE